MSPKAIINPCREKGDPDLPDIGLLCINPGDMRFLADCAKELGATSHFLFNSKLQTIPALNSSQQNIFIAGPAVGASMAVLCLEKLIAIGAEKIIVYGWCGSLFPGLKTGDILIPSWGLSEEGVSVHYPINGEPASDTGIRRILADLLEKEGLRHTTAPVWTTDAPYRETQAKVREYAGRSIMGVDMEFTALTTVAAFRNIKLAAAFLVSDELSGDTWKPGFKAKNFMKKNRQVLQILFEAARAGNFI